MKRGRNTCHQLKSFHRQISDENGIELHQPECTYEGECSDEDGDGVQSYAFRMKEGRLLESNSEGDKDRIHYSLQVRTQT